MGLSLKNAKRLVFVVCLVPLALFFSNIVITGGGPDPGKELVLFTGGWSIRFLLLSLLVTPARRLFRWQKIQAFRRMLGLYAGFYLTLHFLAVMTYFVGWNWAIFLEEFYERPYMSVGIIAAVLMVPLILTSNRWAMRKLGRRWQMLHRLVYPITILGCVHIIWLVRSSYAEALLYTGLTIFCLGVRLWFRYRGRSQRRAS